MRGRDDLTPTLGIGAPVASIVEEDDRAVVGLDDSLEVGNERLIRSSSRVVRPLKPAGNPSLTPALSQIEVLLLRSKGSRGGDLPPSGVGEAYAVERLESHGLVPD